jgi:hypothetical protein
MSEETDPLIVLLWIVLGIFAIPALWIVWVYYREAHECIRLENGAILGDAAVFDLSQPFFQPFAVPKLENGHPIIHDDLWDLYVTPTTLYGTTKRVENGYAFAWRPDTGTVLRHENRDLYESIVADAGHANWDIGTGSYGTGYLLMELIRTGRFPKEWCRTRLVTW